VLLVVDELLATGLLRVRRTPPEAWHTVDDVGHEVKAIQVVQHYHVERRRRSPFLFVTAHVQIPMISSAIRQPVNEQRIRVIRKDVWLVGREEHVEILVAETMRVFALRL
jgi:hypothetical protein